MAINSIPTLCWSVAAKPSGLGVKMHDAGYHALGLDYKYVALGSDQIEPVLDCVKTLGVRGLGVSMPHKGTVMPLLDDVTPDVTVIGACNTVVNSSGRLVGHNTDWQGAWAAIDEAELGECESVVIVGAGGVARAIAYACNKNGMKVHVAARRVDKAQTLVDDLGLESALALEQQDAVKAQLVVNATPDSSVVTAHLLPGVLGVLDVIFQTRSTNLTKAAADRGLKVAPGWRMLLHQGAAQFSLYTEAPAPLDAMAEVLKLALPDS